MPKIAVKMSHISLRYVDVGNLLEIQHASVKLQRTASIVGTVIPIL